MANARYRVGKIFGASLGAATFDTSGEGDFAAFDRHLDFRRVEPDIVGKAIVDVLADALVRADIAFGSASPMIALAATARILVAQPRPQFIARALEKTAILVVP